MIPCLILVDPSKTASWMDGWRKNKRKKRKKRQRVQPFADHQVALGFLLLLGWVPVITTYYLLLACLLSLLSQMTMASSE